MSAQRGGLDHDAAIMEHRAPHSKLGRHADTPIRQSLPLFLPSKYPRKEPLFRLFLNKAESKDVAAELRLVLNELEKLSLTCTQRNSVQDKRMLHVLGRENEPTTVQLADEQVPGR